MELILRGRDIPPELADCFEPMGVGGRTVWRFPTAQTPEAHFATFPEELPARCIEASCPKGGVVLDPFAGIGTTGIVAKRLGRRFIGIELSEKYAEMARKKLDLWWRRATVAPKAAPDGQTTLFGGDEDYDEAAKIASGHYRDGRWDA